MSTGKFSQRKIFRPRYYIRHMGSIGDFHNITKRNFTEESFPMRIIYNKIFCLFEKLSHVPLESDRRNLKIILSTFISLTRFRIFQPTCRAWSISMVLWRVCYSSTWSCSCWHAFRRETLIKTTRVHPKGYAFHRPTRRVTSPSQTLTNSKGEKRNIKNCEYKLN